PGSGRESLLANLVLQERAETLPELLRHPHHEAFAAKEAGLLKGLQEILARRACFQVPSQSLPRLRIQLAVHVVAEQVEYLPTTRLPGCMRVTHATFPWR